MLLYDKIGRKIAQQQKTLQIVQGDNLPKKISTYICSNVKIFIIFKYSVHLQQVNIFYKQTTSICPNNNELHKKKLSNLVQLFELWAVLQVKHRYSFINLDLFVFFHFLKMFFSLKWNEFQFLVLTQTHSIYCIDV